MTETLQQLEPYRTIGPFSRATLPAGLLSEHRLKPGAWGLLEVLSGKLRFVWDQPDSEPLDLAAGDQVLILPEAPHHLEVTDDFSVRITFMRRRDLTGTAAR
ncbi:MAG: DUF1971 domain-containing protein [Proteobacteria bacterium]|nr:DUF1971 domain-containing protein [Pseudomonadota bacterium]